MSDIDLDLSGCKILVTDDVPANLDVLFQALDAEGYNVHVASDGPTALKVAEQSLPDLILLDVMMPGIDGYETCRQLKAQAAIRHIPVVFLTARDDLEGIVEGFESGGVDYITKPFKKEEVLVRIQTHLERAILARRLASINEELELKVAHRTADLVRKVRELEGKDRIAQHLLTFHSLEETLAVVLEVVINILELDQAVVYLANEGEFRPAAAIGLVGENLGDREPSRFIGTSPWAQALRAATQQLGPVAAVAGHPAALGAYRARGRTPRSHRSRESTWGWRHRGCRLEHPGQFCATGCCGNTGCEGTPGSGGVGGSIGRGSRDRAGDIRGRT